MTATTLTQNFFDRHRDKIAFSGPDDCWLWTAGKSRTGYGTVRVCGMMRKAHRVAFEAVHGAGSAEGLVVRHKCDTPSCVNTAHLDCGSQADNNRDKMVRGRFVACKGEAHGLSKLTDEDVRTIRAEYVRGSRDFGQYALARRFRVHQAQIFNVVNHHTWQHI